MQGWYQETPASARERVEIAIDDGALVLSSLADRLRARWALDQLRNRSAPIFDRVWVIGDRRLAEPCLTVENDEDYRAIQGRASGLVPVGRRTWYQLAYAGGNPSGLWALIALVALLALAKWLG